MKKIKFKDDILPFIIGFGIAVFAVAIVPAFTYMLMWWITQSLNFLETPL